MTSAPQPSTLETINRTYWRNLAKDAAQDLVKRSCWHLQVDKLGRNPIMCALAFATDASVIGQMIEASIQQDVWNELFDAQDDMGHRLPAYLLRHATAALLVDNPPWRRALFPRDHDALNSKGHGILAQWATMAASEIPEQDGTMILRNVAFAYFDLEGLSPHDWQAGLDPGKTMRWIAREVLCNEAHSAFAGLIATSTDFEAMEVWLLPLFRSQPQAYWHPVVRHGLNLMQGFCRLVDLPRGSSHHTSATKVIQSIDASLRMYHTYPARDNRPIIPSVLYANDWGHVWEAWEATVAAETLGKLVEQVMDKEAVKTRL